jgi:hypothetical protein
MPAKAGIQKVAEKIDTGLRRYDVLGCCRLLQQANCIPAKAGIYVSPFTRGYKFIKNEKSRPFLAKIAGDEAPLTIYKKARVITCRPSAPFDID